MHTHIIRHVAALLHCPSLLPCCWVMAAQRAYAHKRHLGGPGNSCTFLDTAISQCHWWPRDYSEKEGRWGFIPWLRSQSNALLHHLCRTAKGRLHASREQGLATGPHSSRGMVEELRLSHIHWSGVVAARPWKLLEWVWFLFQRAA